MNAVHSWRHVYADQANKAANGNVKKFLELCQKRNRHPVCVSADWLVGTATKMKSADKFIGDVSIFCKDAFGIDPWAGAESIIRYRKAFAKYKKLNATKLCVVDLQPCLHGIDTFVQGKGGWDKLTPMELRSNGAMIVNLAGGLRLCDGCKLPLMLWRTQPSTVNKLADAEIIWVQVWKPKEALSRSDTQLWSAPIPIYQAPKSDNPRAARNSFGAVADAIVAQAQQRVSFDVSATGFEMGGKQVCLSHLMMHIGRGAGGRLQVARKMERLHSDTLSNAIQKAFDRVQLPTTWTPRLLRHYYATIMTNGMVLRGRWKFEDLQRILRHKSSQTTKDAYVAEGLHPDTQSRWDQCDNLDQLSPWELFWL